MEMKDLPLYRYSALTGVHGPKHEGVEHLARTLSSRSHEQNDPAQVHRAAKEFEGYFISYLLKEMRNTVHPGFVQNKDGQQFYAFYDQEIGRLAAESGGLGLAGMLQLSLDRARAASDQESAQVSPPFIR